MDQADIDAKQPGSFLVTGTLAHLAELRKKRSALAMNLYFLDNEIEQAEKLVALSVRTRVAKKREASDG